MDKDSIIFLQKLDCNCNDCFFMKRDFEKYKLYDFIYTNKQGKVTYPSYRINYGYCEKFNKKVSFIPNMIQLDTQKCFVHRKNN